MTVFDFRLYKVSVTHPDSAAEAAHLWCSRINFQATPDVGVPWNLEEKLDHNLEAKRDNQVGLTVLACTRMHSE